MTENEQAVREWLRGGHYVTSPIAMRDKALALLDAKDEELSGERAAKEWLILKREEAEAERDAKDAEIASLRAYITEAEGYDTALSRAERAEAALAEERKKHQAFREEVSAECAWLRYHGSADNINKHVSRFILPAKPADPLVAVLKECDDDPTDTWAKALAANLRAAIERAGGTISFEGEGADD